MDANLITVLAGVLGSVTGASAAIATTWIAQKNDLVERYDDPVICTYPLSKFGVVVVEKARQNKIDKRPEIWLKRDSLPPRRSVTSATMKAIVSKGSEQSIATEDTLRLMRNNGISPPTVARITRVKTMVSSRPKMWTESQWMPECAAGAADALLRLLRKVEVHQVNRGQIMERQNCNIKEIMESRRHAVEESLRTISVAELNALADELFPDFDHPFLEKFVGVINDPGSGLFYHAHAGDGIQVLYCQNKDIGMWYTPGLGTGRLEPAQLKIMKEIVQARC